MQTQNLIGIFAVPDGLKQCTEIHHEQNNGLFSKQRRTTTDTHIQSKYTGSTLAAKVSARAGLLQSSPKINMPFVLCLYLYLLPVEGILSAWPNSITIALQKQLKASLGM